MKRIAGACNAKRDRSAGFFCCVSARRGRDGTIGNQPPRRYAGREKMPRILGPGGLGTRKGGRGSTACSRRRAVESSPSANGKGSRRRAAGARDGRPRREFVAIGRNAAEQRGRWAVRGRELPVGLVTGRTGRADG